MNSAGTLTLTADDRSYQIAPDRSELLIGRDVAADIVVSDPGCSRRQARIVRVGNTVMLESLSERAQTFVNGRPVAGRVALADGDVIRVGSAQIRVGNGLARSHSTATPAQPAPAGAITLGPGQREMVIGRDAAVAQAVIDHPAISRRHALLTRSAADRFIIKDLGSTNGVSVNGQRISAATALTPGDGVALGPVTFIVDSEGLRPGRTVEGMGLATHDLVFEVSSDGARRRLLDGVSLTIEPGRFVAVLGPSGCGKSTLIRLMSGRTRMSGGTVSVGELDLERHFETIKHSMGFVPQRETLPEELTLRDALRYTGRLRLSADASAADVDRAVGVALTRVGMEVHASKQIAKLSGGQRKRAALANELIARPAVIFADEVTSGLDDSTDREIMRLFQELASAGVTIICVTHTVSNIMDCCDEIVVMAPGGRLSFHGSPKAALEHFEVSNLGAIYEQLDAPKVAPAAAARRNGRSNTGNVEARPDRRAPLAQLPTLATRTAAVALANRRGLAFIASQSLLVGLLFRLVFGTDSLPAESRPLFAFLLGIAGFWFGCSNASKEIVKERGLFRLERDINLRIPSYVLSKLIVLGTIGVLQVILLFATISLTGVNIPRPGVLLSSNLLIVLVGVALGLVVSAFSRKEEQAASLVPMALIPQLLLSAALVPQLSELAVRIAKGLVSAYWMNQMELDLLAADGAVWGGPVLIFAVHGAVYTVLAGVLLYADRSSA